MAEPDEGGDINPALVIAVIVVLAFAIFWFKQPPHTAERAHIPLPDGFDLSTKPKGGTKNAKTKASAKAKGAAVKKVDTPVKTSSQKAPPVVSVAAPLLPQPAAEPAAALSAVTLAPVEAGADDDEQDSAVEAEAGASLEGPSAATKKKKKKKAKSRTDDAAAATDDAAAAAADAEVAAQQPEAIPAGWTAVSKGKARTPEEQEIHEKVVSLRRRKVNIGEQIRRLEEGMSSGKPGSGSRREEDQRKTLDAREKLRNDMDRVNESIARLQARAAGHAAEQTGEDQGEQQEEEHEPEEKQEEDWDDNGTYWAGQGSERWPAGGEGSWSGSYGGGGGRKGGSWQSHTDWEPHSSSWDQKSYSSGQSGGGWQQAWGHKHEDDGQQWWSGAGDDGSYGPRRRKGKGKGKGKENSKGKGRSDKHGGGWQYGESAEEARNDGEGQEEGAGQWDEQAGQWDEQAGDDGSYGPRRGKGKGKGKGKEKSKGKGKSDKHGGGWQYGESAEEARNDGEGQDERAGQWDEQAGQWDEQAGQWDEQAGQRDEQSGQWDHTDWGESGWRGSRGGKGDSRGGKGDRGKGKRGKRDRKNNKGGDWSRAEEGRWEAAEFAAEGSAAAEGTAEGACRGTGPDDDAGRPVAEVRVEKTRTGKELWGDESSDDDFQPFTARQGAAKSGGQAKNVPRWKEKNSIRRRQQVDGTQEATLERE